MKAGTLRHRVQIERPYETRNEYGEPVLTWLWVASAWASVEPISGREAMQAMATAATVSHRVKMRFSADVQPDRRLIFEERVLGISAVIDVGGRRRELEVLCTEVVG